MVFLHFQPVVCVPLVVFTIEVHQVISQVIKFFLHSQSLGALQCSLIASTSSAGKIQELIKPVQAILHWDEAAKTFGCQIVWDDTGKKPEWGFFGKQ